jgi:hypothetical protein
MSLKLCWCCSLAAAGRWNLALAVGPGGRLSALMFLHLYPLLLDRFGL